MSGPKKNQDDDNPKSSAAPPDTTDLKKLKTAAKQCLVCPFAQKATQTVFGKGPRKARWMIIGECPGDMEDRQGAPFVGPAGHLLQTILKEIGVDPDLIYFTNAVKHFKFSWRGNRRLHSKPNAAEIHACHPWLAKEIEAVHPDIVMTLGATAAYSFFGRRVRIQQERGRWLDPPLALPHPVRAITSWHPSAILRRIKDPNVKKRREELKQDLHMAWTAIQSV